MRGGDSIKTDRLGRSRIYYIIEAALEYFISILMSGSYLATLTSELGISDSLTGIISAFISLGCLFQLLSVFLKRPRVKGIVISLSVLNQILFLFLYMIPLFGWDSRMKTVIFICTIFAAYLIYNSIQPLKTNWLMSLVEDGRRGVFTSQKEIISLISGMAFSFAGGSMIDYYRDSGDIRTAFVICGVTVFALMLLHTATLFMSAEPATAAVPAKKNPLGEILGTFRDKTVLKVTVLFVIWSIATNSATPFYGTYMIKELGFNLKFVSVLTAVYSVARASVSIFWGRYADRYSFAKMVRICFVIAGVGFLVNIFTVPENGAVFYTLYYTLYAVAMGGINSALMNLVFDYVGRDRRSNALALSSGVSGLTGFLTALAVSGVVAYIQQNGNVLFGLHLYAQQAVSAIALVFTAAAVVYVSIVIIPIKKVG